MSEHHTSVLLQEALHFLNVMPGGKYIDGTLGGGGHTFAIIDRGGRVLGIDQDEDALRFVLEKLADQSPDERNKKVELVRGNFSEIRNIATEHDFIDIDGILFDLGVSSHQFDEAKRGFSFSANGPLDMRMDQQLGVKAADLVNALPERELSDIFFRYGEERNARYLARILGEERKKKPFETTGELADVIKKHSRFGFGKLHPATRVFQALRIAVNDEMRVLENALPEAFSLLKPGGRLVVISFHSLEDRIVKQTFADLSEKEMGKILTKKPIVPTDEEIAQNNRARSAKLRSIEKV